MGRKTHFQQLFWRLLMTPQSFYVAYFSFCLLVETITITTAIFSFWDFQDYAEFYYEPPLRVKIRKVSCLCFRISLSHHFLSASNNCGVVQVLLQCRLWTRCNIFEYLELLDFSLNVKGFFLFQPNFCV